MDRNQLTPYLLDSSLVQYTVTVANDALRPSDLTHQEQTTRRAIHALEFFLDILDPSIEEEKAQLDIFKRYRAALSAQSVSKTLLAQNPPPATVYKTVFLQLTPSQKVLSLPDTLDLILDHIPILTKSGKDTLLQASLTSRAFHNAAERRLWKRLRDLDTVDKQVRFAFGASISRAVGESLGNFVQRLRIRVAKSGWNMPVVHKVVSLTPNVTDFTLHWGKTLEGPDHVTNECVAFVHKTLSDLPNLKHLSLLKFTYTPEIDVKLDIPNDAHLPFVNLDSLQIYDFQWYWTAIFRGLSSSLNSLRIDYGTMIRGREIEALSGKLSSLKILCVRVGCTLSEIRAIVANLPGLEEFDMTNFSETEENYVQGLVHALASLAHLKSLALSNTVEVAQLDVLLVSHAPLEDVFLTLKATPDAGDTIVKLLKSKKESLKNIYISFEGVSSLPVTDEIVDALANIPNLERIAVEFSSSHQLSASSVNALLRQCPNLVLTDALEIMVAGKPLYAEKYKAKLEEVRDEEEKEMEEDILAN